MNIQNIKNTLGKASLIAAGCGLALMVAAPSFAQKTVTGRHGTTATGTVSQSHSTGTTASGSVTGANGRSASGSGNVKVMGNTATASGSVTGPKGGTTTASGTGSYSNGTATGSGQRDRTQRDHPFRDGDGRQRLSDRDRRLGCYQDLQRLTSPPLGSGHHKTKGTQPEKAVSPLSLLHGSYSPPDPGSAILRCISADTASGRISAAWP